MSRFRPYAAATVVSFIAALLVVLKVFTAPDCWAFDANDDANHTFPHLFVAQNVFRTGEIPQMNFYNNFGTPLLGDALTYPFALHSITYWFFEGPVAMTINRAVFAWCTVFLGFLFFRKHLSDSSSILCSFWVFFSAVNLWFFSSFHMQLALFFEFLLLVLLQQLNAEPRARTAFAILAVASVMILSLSINLSFFVTALLIGSQWIGDRFRVSRKGLLLLTAIVGALIVTSFQLDAFYQGIKQSNRVHGHYDPRAVFDFDLLIRRILRYVKVEEQRIHVTSAVFLSIPVVLFLIAGVFVLCRKKSPLLPTCLLLGVVLPLFCFTLMIFPSIWWNVPLLAATDLTRILWLALPFMFLAVGSALDWIRERPLCRAWPWATSVLLWTTFVVAENPSVKAILGLRDLCKCRNTHHYALYEHFKMRPEGLATCMAPLSRYTFDERSNLGNDLRGAYYELFGSCSRAIISSRALREHLTNLNLVEIETDPNLTYHFKAPWDAAVLNRLGIRYVVLDKALDENSSVDWALIATEKDHFEKDRFLYENKLVPSPLYFVDHGEITPLRSFKIVGNQLVVDLPKSDKPRELVATFLNLPDYTVLVDGAPTEHFSPTNDLPFIHVTVNPGDSVLTIKFERYTWEHLILLTLLGLAFFGVGTFLLRIRS